MIFLGLNRTQLALGAFAFACFVAAVATLLTPPPALPDPPAANEAATERLAVVEPLTLAAADPESPLVQRNLFDASRRAPARRRTGNQDDTAAAASAQPAYPLFTLLGVVTLPNGRNIAVIRSLHSAQAGTYHVGDEVTPGYRVTRITRSGATVVGAGQRHDLAVAAGPAAGVVGGVPGAQ